MQKEQTTPVLMNDDRLIGLQRRRETIDRIGRHHGAGKKHGERHVTLCMKTIAMLCLLAASSLSIAGCSSSGNVNEVTPRPDIVLEQLVGPADLGYPGGRIDIQYQMSVVNHSKETIRLRYVDIASSGTGAYVLRRDTIRFDETIGPDHYGAVTFWVHALQAGSFGRGSNEPVTIRGIVHFESPRGPFHQLFIKEIGQFAGQ
jgi:hypothetical protein